LLARVGVTSKAELELRRVAGKETLRTITLALDSKPNSDYYPLLDLGAEKSRFMQADVRELLRLRTPGFLLLEHLDGFEPLSNLRISDNDVTILGAQAREGLQYAHVLSEWANSTLPLQYNAEYGLSEKDFGYMAYLLSETGCANSPGASWLNDISRILIATLPYANTHALDKPIDKLMQLSCANRTPDTMFRLSFIRAINDRDFAVILAQGQKLLALDNVPLEAKTWLAFNASVAALALKDYSAMSSIWTPYANKHAPEEIERKVLDLALAKAIVSNKSRIKGQAATPAEKP